MILCFYSFYCLNWTDHGTVLDGRSSVVECQYIVSYTNIRLDTLFPGDLWFRFDAEHGIFAGYSGKKSIYVFNEMSV